MKKLLSFVCAGALAIAMVAPATAQGQDTTGITSSMHPGGGYRMVRNGRRHHGHHHSHGRHYRHGNHGFYHRGGHAYYHGHRGYRHYRRGYREYNGFWFPGAAFLGGAIIGGAIANSYHGGNAHVRWCYDHYRSYRASDNTYQPYHGPRRECVGSY